jgi:hypothetical protein
MYLGSGANIVEQPPVMKPGIPPSPADLEGLRLLWPSKYLIRKSEATADQWTVDQSDSPAKKTYYKPFRSVLRKLQLSRQFRLHWYHLHQDE